MKRWENTLYTLWNYSICSFDFRYTEAVIPEISSEQVLLKIPQCWSLFLIKLQAFRPAILLKRDSNIGAFLWNLKSLRASYLQNTSSGCFWKCLMNSLFIAYENDESCRYVYVLALQCLFHFIVCVSFLSISFSFSYLFCGFYSLIRSWGKFVNA